MNIGVRLLRRSREARTRKNLIDAAENIKGRNQTEKH